MFPRIREITISSWIYVFDGINTKQGIQGASWKTCASTFDAITTQAMIKVMKNDNIHVLALLMFYNNRKSLVYKLLAAVVYCILDNHVCIEYLCLKK